MSTLRLHYASGRTLVLLEQMIFVFSQRCICYLIKQEMFGYEYSKLRDSGHILLVSGLILSIKKSQELTFGVNLYLELSGQRVG